MAAIEGLGGQGFIRMAGVSTRPGSTSTEGCLFDDDRWGVIGVGITDTGGEASVISVTVCSIPWSGLSPATVVALNGKAFCAKMDGEACIVPDTEADLIKWPGVKDSDEAEECEGLTGAPGDPPKVLGDQRGLEVFGVSGKV
jgi:hypothetical protein